MKKTIALVLFLLVGACNINKMTNTPTKQVEIFFNKYQTVDKDVLKDLDRVILLEPNFNSKQQGMYRDLMKKHYRDLLYEIKDETIDGNKAVVTVEIDVKDYSKILNEAENHFIENQSEFLNESGVTDLIKFSEYKLEQLKKTKDRVIYTLDLSLTKKDKMWKMDQISSVDEEKIHGIYIY